MAGNKLKVTGAIPVTPSDTVDNVKTGSIGLNIGVAGFVEVIFSIGSPSVPLYAQAGDVPWEGVTRVLVAGTTATNIAALY